LKSHATAVIVFVRNAILGKVKTRIGASTGATEALKIYQQLCELTIKQIKSFESDKYVYYSDYIENADSWDSYFKVQQQGDDLGSRMFKAFQQLLVKYEKVILIGSDCPYLQSSHLIEAANVLDEKDCVFGPAYDGGYYLIGLRRLIPQLFENMPWSTDKLLKKSIQSLLEYEISFQLLEILEDIDTLQDWSRFLVWEAEN
jgi:rSAM/selenodomain-associated transferase 1